MSQKTRSPCNNKPETNHQAEKDHLDQVMRKLTEHCRNQRSRYNSYQTRTMEATAGAGGTT